MPAILLSLGLAACGAAPAITTPSPSQEATSSPPEPSEAVATPSATPEPTPDPAVGAAREHMIAALDELQRLIEKFQADAAVDADDSVILADLAAWLLWAEAEVAWATDQTSLSGDADEVLQLYMERAGRFSAFTKAWMAEFYSSATENAAQAGTVARELLDMRGQILIMR